MSELGERLATTSESPTSDGSVIISHGKLLVYGRQRLQTLAFTPTSGDVGVRGELNKKLAQTRGENWFHAVPPDL